MSPTIDLGAARAARSASTAAALAAGLSTLDLPVTQIVQHPLNPAARSDVDEDLAADIRAAGEIYERLVVRPAPGQDGKYELLSGHRRFAAAQHLAMLLVPVRVVDMDDVAAATFLLRANQSRKDLKLVEEAVMVQGLLDLPDAPTQHALAESLGRSDTWVSRRAKIARKPEPVLTALAASSSALTFDDVDALEEFDDDPALQAEVAAAHGTSNWNWSLNQARQARRTAAFYTKADALLRKAGAVVEEAFDAEIPEGLRHADYLWEGSDAAKLVKKLGIGEGWWARRYQYQAGYVLFRPRTQEDIDEIARRDERAAYDEKVRADQAAEREARDRTNAARRAFADATTDLRRDFLRRLIDGKALDRSTAPRDAIVTFTAGVIAVAFDRAITIGGDLYDAVEELAPWIGLDLSQVAEDAAAADHDPEVATEAAFRNRATEIAPPQLLLAALAAQVEPLSPWAWEAVLTDESIVAAWYRLLAALGYEPSTAETEALAGRLPEADS